MDKIFVSDSGTRVYVHEDVFKSDKEVEQFVTKMYGPPYRIYKDNVRLVYNQGNIAVKIMHATYYVCLVQTSVLDDKP